MSFYDMIPDEELTMPISGTHGDRYVLRSKVNLIDTVCGQCGETFVRHTGHVAYTRMHKHKQLYFCSWRCLCRWEEANPIRKKGGSTKTLQERIDYRILRMINNRKMLDGEEAASLSAEERKKIRNRLAWDAKMIRELEEELEIERK